jgi:hypothetical protein
MAGAETASANICANCRTSIQGKFCSSCGAPASPPHAQPREGWSGITAEFLSSRGGNGLFAVVLSFLRRPVDTIIRLTDDPGYRSHWGFLTATVGAQLTLLYIVMPRVLSALFNVPSTASSSAVLTTEIVQYVGMAILTPIQYYVCRALGTTARSPMSYVKLCVLSVGFGALLSSIAALIVFVSSIVIMKTAVGTDVQGIVQTVGEIFGALTMVGVLVFVSASHKRFWGMSWPIAIGVTLAIAVVSWKVVYPGLFALAERADIAETLKTLSG